MNIKRLQQLLSPEASAELDPPDITGNPERMDLVASGAQVAATRPIGDLPLTVLEAGGSDSDDLDGTQQAMAELWSMLQAELAALERNSTHTVVPNSGHFIQNEQPDVVIDAIRAIILQ